MIVFTGCGNITSEVVRVPSVPFTTGYGRLFFHRLAQLKYMNLSVK